MRIAMVAALAVIASCGDGAGDGAGGGDFSCRAAFPGADGGAGMIAVCIDAMGATAQQVASGRQMCAAQSNMFAEELCPRTGALGGCRQTTAGSPVLTTWYYADGGSTSDDIRMLCEGLASIAPSIVRIEFVLP
jgi:hypothetical protein